MKKENEFNHEPHSLRVRLPLPRKKKLVVETNASDESPLHLTGEKQLEIGKKYANKPDKGVKVKYISEIKFVGKFPVRMDIEIANANTKGIDKLDVSDKVLSLEIIKSRKPSDKQFKIPDDISFDSEGVTMTNKGASACTGLGCIECDLIRKALAWKPENK